MSKLRKIQLFLLTAMVILIVIVIVSFKGKSKEKVKKTAKTERAVSQNIEAGGTRMESGVHVLYRDGVPYATVHFKEAVQDKGQTHLSAPVVTMASAPGKLTADSADLQGNLIVLKGKISLISEKDDISVSLVPPAAFRDGILTGSNAFEMKLNGGTFRGRNFVFKIKGNELLGKENAEFFNGKEGFRILGQSGIANLQDKTLAFVKNVQVILKGKTANRTTADSAFLEMVSGRLFLGGEGEIDFSSSSKVRFTETVLWKKDSLWNGSFSSPIRITSPGRVIFLPNGELKGDELKFPWSILQSGEKFVNTGAGSFSFNNSKINASAPIMTTADAVIRGRNIQGFVSGEKTNVSFPLVQRIDGSWLTGNLGILKSGGHVEISGNVNGTVENRIFRADSAKRDDAASVRLKNAVVWDESSLSFSTADEMAVSKKQFSATGNYRMKQLRKEGKAPLNVYASKATGIEDGPTHLIRNVRTKMEDLNVNAEEAYVYKWGAVFFNARFSGARIKKGRADLLLVLEKQHVVWMLGNADVMDRGGNRLTGHKLTLSTITGRISVYSGKEKVRIKLAL